MATEQTATKTARDYYNSEDADLFYAQVWGGEDIHIGLYQQPDESIFDASRRTVEHMASRPRRPGAQTRVLDIGRGDLRGSRMGLLVLNASHIDVFRPVR